jgi:hypothetical protein
MIEGVLLSIYEVFKVSWWFLAPLALFFIFLEFWLKYVRSRFSRNMKWIVLEIKIPKEVEKSPKAMEQVFAALHGIYSLGINFWQKYWEGKIEEWMSLEIIGQSGGVSFYLRCPEIYRNLVESAVYSQYPDAEIVLTEDYINFLPAILPNKTYDIWGADLVLARENAYSLRTYSYFEEKEKEKRLDPIAAIVEVMSGLKGGEAIWLQLLIRPTGEDWKKAALALRDKLMGRKKPKGWTFIDELGAWIKNYFAGHYGPPVWPGATKPEAGSPLVLSPGEREIIEAIENKISKIAFESMLRFLYIDHRASFTRTNISAVIGSLRQFSALNLNFLKIFKKTVTSATGLFKARNLYLRKRAMWDSYRSRKLLSKMPILNTEELATLFHFPAIMVEAPTLKPVAAKKGEPPAELPME